MEEWLNERTEARKLLDSIDDPNNTMPIERLSKLASEHGSRAIGLLNALIEKWQARDNDTLLAEFNRLLTKYKPIAQRSSDLDAQLYDAFDRAKPEYGTDLFGKLAYQGEETIRQSFDTPENQDIRHNAQKYYTMLTEMAKILDERDIKHDRIPRFINPDRRARYEEGR